MSVLLLNLARGLLPLASFAGLSAFIRVRFNVNRFLAPFVAASGIIVILTLAGMLNALWGACALIYALGILALIRAYSKTPPPSLLILLFLLFSAFLLWRFWDCKLRHYDDFSHWGTIARFLVLRDRLPVEADHALTHQSYPPGSACWIYFFSNPLGPKENIFLAAHGLLHGVALLPLFAFVRGEKRRAFLPIAAALIFSLLIYPCHDVDLLVDYLQPFFGIGIAAVAVYYRRRPARALALALPGMIAVALFKNSGLFFSLSSAALLICVLRPNLRGAKLRADALTAVAAPVLAYLLWTLRVRLCFPTAGAGGHSISPALYAQHLANKGISGVLGVAKGMLSAMLQLSNWRIGIVAAILAAAVLSLAASRRLPAASRRRVRGFALFALVNYLVWLLMLFGMYVFSMTGSGAQEATSFVRYNGSGYIYAAGLLFLLLLYVVQRDEVACPPALCSAAGAASGLALAGALALALLPGFQTPLDAFFVRSQPYNYVHGCLATTWEQNPRLYGERCLVFFLYDEEQSFRNYGYTRNNIRYQFGAGDCPQITAQRTVPERLQILNQPAEPSELQEYIARNLEDCAAVILLDESPAFEAALEAAFADGGVELPIYRAYETAPGASGTPQ